MKKIMLISILSLFSLLVLGQEKIKENRLQQTVRKMHVALAAVGKDFEPNQRYLWQDFVYLSDGVKLEKVRIDSLKSMNYLDYDISIVYDNTNIPPMQFYQGIIVITLTSKARKEKFLNYVREQKKKGQM